MRSAFFKLPTFLLLLGVATNVHSAERVGGIPNFHLEPASNTLHELVLGSACYSLPGTALDLSCNPAFLSTEEKKQFRVNVSINEQVKVVNEYRKTLDSGDPVSVVDAILNRNEPLLAKAVGSVWFQHEWWAVGYTPLRVGLASFIRNPAYPEITAHIFKESEIFARAGFVATEEPNFHFGVELKYLDRDFFRNRFALLDARSAPDLLKIEKHRAFHVNPGISYDFEGAWASAVSLALTNVRVWQEGASIPFTPVLDVGFMTSPPFAGGKLKTTTHFTNHPDIPDLFSRFRWAAIYDWTDVLSVSAMLGKSSAGLGVNGHIDSVVLGAGIKTEEITPDQWQSERVSTVLLELGLVF